MKKISGKIEKGGMLLEMIAVLGLVAISAPAIYKKNVERTEEIRDMTKASQLRVLKDAASQYIEKQYETLIRNTEADKPMPIDIGNLENYLPEGYVADEGISVYLMANKNNSTTNRPQGTLSALVIDGEEVTESRGNRIARMIGVEGGYTLDNNIYGSRGAWSLSSADLGVTEIPANRVAVTTTYGKSMSSSDYIYRNKVEGYPEANMMFTDIDMNGSSINHIGRLAMRYNNGEKWAEPTIGGDTEGSNGGDGRDNGLSLLVHGQRGEIIGQTRSSARDGNEYEWWKKKKDSSGTVIPEGETTENTSHYNEKATLELSVGGNDKAEHDGYLRLRAGTDNSAEDIGKYGAPTENVSCARIESNFNGGGAFLACTNLEEDEDDATGKLGTTTAALIADDGKDIDGKGGSGYMVVTNLKNKRKATIYGNYGAVNNKYNGAAMVATDKNDAVKAVVASELAANATGNGVIHDKKSSVASLYDNNGNVKTQFRADAAGGYIYAFGEDNALPSVAIKGSKDTDLTNPNESYAVITQKAGKGYASMQGIYEDDQHNEAGAAITVKTYGGKNTLAVMGSGKESSTASASAMPGGYFALKTVKNGTGYDRFKAISGDTGGAIYMGNDTNTGLLKGVNPGNNQTVAIETGHNVKTKSLTEGGYMKLSGGKSFLEITSADADANATTGESGIGGGMFATNADGKVTAKIHTATKGKIGSAAGIGNADSSGVALYNDKTGGKAELVTAEGNAGNYGGALSLNIDQTNRNVIIVARTANNGSWMSVKDKNNDKVNLYANYGKNGGALTVKDASGKQVVSMYAGQNTSNANPIVTVGNGTNTTKISGRLENSAGGYTVTSANASVKVSGNSGNGGGIIKIDENNAAQIASDGGELKIGGSIVINGKGDLTANNINSSVRIKVGNNLQFDKGSDNTISAMIFDAAAYNGTGSSGTIKNYFYSLAKQHALFWFEKGVADEATDIGHHSCWIDETLSYRGKSSQGGKKGNCPNYVYFYDKDENGNTLDTYHKVTPEEYAAAGNSLSGREIYGGFVMKDKPWDGYDIGTYTWGRYGNTSSKDATENSRKYGVTPGRLHDYGIYAYKELSDGIKHETYARHYLEYNLKSEPDKYTKFMSSGGSEGASYPGSHAEVVKWHDNKHLMDTGSWSRWTDYAVSTADGKLDHPSRNGEIPESLPDAFPLNYNYDDPDH